MTIRHVDSNNNAIDVAIFGDVAICLMADNHRLGYVADRVVDDAQFGDECCPSSYGWAVRTWFGPGERFQNANSAIRDTREK